MKIQNTFITRGPNCWSMQHHRLIVLDLELQSWEQDVTSRIPNFSHTVISRLSALFGIHDAGVTGNELIRQSEGGTLPGYLIAIISLQLQRQVGVNCSYIMAGAFEAVFEYMDKKVGLLASQLAVKIGESLWRQGPLDIAEDVRLMQQALEQAGNSQLTLSITTEAIKRNIPCIYLYKKQLVQFGYGANQRRIQTSHTDRTSNIGMRISGDKQLTKEMLSSFGVPVPLGRLVKDIESLFKAIKKIGYPIVLKPVGANNGNGVSVNISNSDDAVRAFGAAARFSGPVGVIVEKFIAGSDYRLLVINHKLVAAAKRTPASVTGNGVSTIEELINVVNSDPRRGNGHSKPLTIIEADEETLAILKRSRLSLKSILPHGKTQFLKSIANLSAGGTSADVTDSVHPDNIFMAERISRIVGLDICGMDVISPDIGSPFNLNGGSVVEVNSGPGLRLHMEPAEGKPRNVAGSIIDMLFPDGSPSRIPIIAIAGNGLIACELIEQLIAKLGYKVGSATSRGVYIQNHMVQQNNATGYAYAELVLKDPTVDLAVFECSLSDIYRNGLAFLNCDIGIVIDPDTSDRVATQAAAVITGCTSNYAILNADNETVHQLKRPACSIAYFSEQEHNPLVMEHIQKGGHVAVIENGYITYRHGSGKVRIICLNDFKAKSNMIYQNMLAAALVAAIYQIDVVIVKEIMEAFMLSH